MSYLINNIVSVNKYNEKREKIKSLYFNSHSN